MRTRTLTILLISSLTGTPGCRRPGVDAELDRLEGRYAEDTARVEGVALDLTRLSVTQRQVIATYVEAKRQWETSQSLYQEAASQQALATRTLEQAAADFEEAERNFKIAAIAMATLAAGSIICSGKVSTRQYRANLEREGMPMDRLEDVDHIFPRSRGGIDHPLNFQPLERSLNRSLGNKVVDKFLQAPVGFVTGMAVSALGVIGGCN